MRAEKSHFSVYSSLPKINTASKPVNIVDLIKKYKAEEKKEKIQKIYAPLSFIGLILLLGIFLL